MNPANLRIARATDKFDNVNRVIPNAQNYFTIPDGGGALSVQQVIDAVSCGFAYFNTTGATGATAYTLPTANALIAALPATLNTGNVLSFKCFKSAAAGTVTIAASTGGTGTTLTVSANKLSNCLIQITNETTPAYSLFGTTSA